MDEPILDPIIPEVTIPPPDNSGMDDIDRIIAGYQNSAKFDTPIAPPGQTIYQQPTPQAQPFISHEPYQGQPEYYVRGKKKGQLKPPRKGTAPPLNQAGQLSIQATVFITGAIFITMVDLLLPLIITGIYNYMQRKKKGAVLMDYEKMKMSASQKADLAPVGDAVVRELKLNGSPTLLFLLGLAGVYFMNFIMQKSIAEKNAAIQQRKDDEQAKKAQNNSPINQGQHFNSQSDAGNYKY